MIVCYVLTKWNTDINFCLVSCPVELKLVLTFLRLVMITAFYQIYFVETFNSKIDVRCSVIYLHVNITIKRSFRVPIFQICRRAIYRMRSISQWIGLWSLHMSSNPAGVSEPRAGRKEFGFSHTRFKISCNTVECQTISAFSLHC